MNADSQSQDNLEAELHAALARIDTLEIYRKLSGKEIRHQRALIEKLMEGQSELMAFALKQINVGKK